MPPRAFRAAIRNRRIAAPRSGLALWERAVQRPNHWGALSTRQPPPSAANSHGRRRRRLSRISARSPTSGSGRWHLAPIRENGAGSRRARPVRSVSPGTRYRCATFLPAAPGGWREPVIGAPALDPQAPPLPADRRPPAAPMWGENPRFAGLRRQSGPSRTGAGRRSIPDRPGSDLEPHQIARPTASTCVPFHPSSRRDASLGERGITQPGLRPEPRSRGTTALTDETDDGQGYFLSVSSVVRHPYRPSCKSAVRNGV